MIDFKQQRFAVIGFGDSGISIINYLNYRKADIVKVFDTRTNPPGLDLVKDYPCFCGALKAELFVDVDVIVISPGVSIYEPVLAQMMCQGKKIIGDVELFALAIEDWSSKVIGITGSNGKTTVTELTGYLSKQLGYATLISGNIGTPVLNSYLDIIKTGAIPEIIVLELSSFQLETTVSLKLDAATVLNISEDHLDRYRDLLQYAYVKSNIFDNATTQVLNYDDELVRAMKRDNGNRVYFACNHNTEGISSEFSLIEQGNKTYLQAYTTKIIATDELQLVGMHNYMNCLASIALLHACGVDIYGAQLADALRSFVGVPHRMQKVYSHNDIIYIEDSKGTNVGAVIAGVSGLDRPVHLILGGDGKGQDFQPLRRLVNDRCRSVAIIGRDKTKIAAVLDGLSLPIVVCETLEQAVGWSISHAKANEYVVLSPACASWDMFDNYKHRAQVFIDSIHEILK
jgi:UDP-N-acetylmuramoylalanine--D-glutamate ligase